MYLHIISIMKLKTIKQLEGECCPFDLIKGEPHQKLHCVICYQVMTKPVALSCGSGHTFGMACLKEWIKNRENILCPYCRGPAETWVVPEGLEVQLQKLEGVCLYCNQWKGSLTKLEHHKASCMKFYEFLQKELQKIITLQKQQLDIEINPHLKQHHTQIYNKYVQDWVWLGSSSENWKWWWQCSNSWWKNISCPTCNKLWHKYENKIDSLEAQRVYLLGLINHHFIMLRIKHLFQPQD